MEADLDISLHFIQRGTAGFPLILLHGNGESGAYFERQMEAFARHARVIAVDTRGHGESPRGSKPFTLAQFAEDLRAFMDRQGIDRADLLGFSDGGNIALLFALRYPHRVGKLVLNGANLRPSGVRPLFQLPLCLHYGLVCLLSPLRPGLAPQTELLRLMVREPRIPTSALHGVTAPALVIAGEKDLIRSGHTRAIAKALPKGVLCFLPGDHFIAYKNPKAFNRMVGKFLWGQEA